MVTRASIETRFGDIVHANVEMVRALLVDLDPDTTVAVSPVADEDVFRVTLCFSENARHMACIDTQRLAELRSTVAGFDTHLLEVTVECDAHSLVYEMMNMHNIPVAEARVRCLFHRCPNTVRMFGGMCEISDRFRCISTVTSWSRRRARYTRHISRP